jgi:hypothetical protein
MPEMTGWGIFWASLALVVIYVARVFILKACCAVCDVKEPHFLLTALWAFVVLGVVVGLAGSFYWLFHKLDADPDELLGTMGVTGVIFSLAVSWALAGLLYWLVLNTSAYKGLSVAAIELLLTGLVAALVACLWLVGLAIMQIGGSELVWRLFLLIFNLTATVLVWTSWCFLFSKARRPGWAGFIPIYNIAVLLDVAGRPIWWIALFFVPGVNIVMGFIVALDVAKKFGKGVGFGIALGLLPFIFYPVLAFGDAQYESGFDEGERLAPAPA